MWLLTAFVPELPTGVPASLTGLLSTLALALVARVHASLAATVLSLLTLPVCVAPVVVPGVEPGVVPDAAPDVIPAMPAVPAAGESEPVVPLAGVTSGADPTVLASCFSDSPAGDCSRGLPKFIACDSIEPLPDAGAMPLVGSSWLTMSPAAALLTTLPEALVVGGVWPLGC